MRCFVASVICVARAETKPGASSLPEEIICYIQALSRALHLEDTEEKVSTIDDDYLDEHRVMHLHLGSSVHVSIN